MPALWEARNKTAERKAEREAYEWNVIAGIEKLPFVEEVSAVNHRYDDMQQIEKERVERTMDTSSAGDATNGDIKGPRR